MCVKDGDYIKATATTTPGGPIAHKGLKLGCCVFVALLSVAAIVLGAVLPSIVSNAVRKGVLETVRFDPAHMEDDTLAKFYNGSTPVEYYLYSCTNLKLVLTTGAVPLFQEFGPVKMDKIQIKYSTHTQHNHWRIRQACVNQLTPCTVLTSLLLSFFLLFFLPCL